MQSFIKPILFSCVALLALTQLSACSHRPAYGHCAFRTQTGDCYQEPRSKVKDADITAQMFAAADVLLQPLKTPLSRQQTIISTSIADLNDIEHSSGLGRLLGEQLAARFTQRGYTVVEVKFRDNILVQEQNGEFMLSRRLDAIQNEHAAEYVCAGTYSVAHDQVFVSLKLLKDNGVVLASHVLTLPLGPNVEALLNEQ